MTTKSKAEKLPALEAYTNAFEKHRANSSSPAWLQAIHRSGISHFVELGFPTLKQEDWIFTNVAPIAKMAFKPVLKHAPGQISVKGLEAHTFQGLTGNRLVFVDGHFDPQLSVVSTPSTDATITHLAGAVTSNEKSVEAHLSRYARVDESGFSALNAAFFTDGAFIHVPAGRTVSEPIHILYLSSGQDAGLTAFPRNLIIAEANSRVKVVETYYSTAHSVHFTNAVTEIAVGQGGHLEHCKFQDENLEAFHIATVQAHLGEKAHYTSHSISTGARITRNNINLVLGGEWADCVMNGLYLVGEKQLVDHHTIADHAKPNCGSHEFYHGILGGQARAVFNGKIFVRKDAQKTDAKQTNRNLLLTEMARVDTKPQLEILADDVKCTHGATVGQLNEDAIFYFRTRGIGEVTARQMLTHAFAGEILNRITLIPVREHLEQVLWQRLENMTAGNHTV